MGMGEPLKPKYGAFYESLKQKGFEFEQTLSNYDVYTDGKRKVSICAPCRLLKFERMGIIKKMKLFQFTELLNML
jgi:hypothetical protein